MRCCLRKFHSVSRIHRPRHVAGGHSMEVGRLFRLIPCQSVAAPFLTQLCRARHHQDECQVGVGLIVPYASEGSMRRCSASEPVRRWQTGCLGHGPNGRAMARRSELRLVKPLNETPCGELPVRPVRRSRECSQMTLTTTLEMDQGACPRMRLCFSLNLLQPLSRESGPATSYSGLYQRGNSTPNME